MMEGGDFFRFGEHLIVDDFEQYLHQTNDATWVDYNNDGYLDAFFTGIPNNKLYKNNGDETFTQVENALTSLKDDEGNPIASGTSVWADFDKDGDVDVYISGAEFTDQNDRLFENKGNGIFEDITDSANLGDFKGKACWGDYDNDSDLDIFIVEKNYNVEKEQSALYRNNGNGTFDNVTQEDMNISGASSCNWGDYNNDGYLDLFIATGEQTGRKLFTNNGDGSFTQFENEDFENDRARCYGGASWVDIDRNGTLDIFVANVDGYLDYTYNDYFYQNNGNSNNWLSIKCVGTSSNRSAIGAKIEVETLGPGAPKIQYREIVGKATYLTQNPFDAHFGMGKSLFANRITVTWPSGKVQTLHSVKVNQHLEIIEPGPFDPPHPKEYTFSRVRDIEIARDNASNRNAVWGDFNNDGMPDLLAGANPLTGPDGEIRLIYINKGNGAFEQVTDRDNPLVKIKKISMYYFDATWADFNNDGNLDIFISNIPDYNAIYTGNGEGSFSEQFENDFVVNYECHKIWFGRCDENSRFNTVIDYNNDGWMDIFISGSPDKLYKNNGDGTFQQMDNELTAPDLEVRYTAWADYDRDGFTDVFFSTGSLFRNRGDGTFERINGETGGITKKGVASWGDFDNDNDPDLFIAHSDGNALFRNDNGSFVEVTPEILGKNPGSAGSWGDYDNDGFLDLFITVSSRPNMLFRNNGNGTFTQFTEPPILNDLASGSGASTWIDYDRNGTLDLFVVNKTRKRRLNDFVYSNRGNHNNWISLVMPPSAIGAKVTAAAIVNGVYMSQYREVAGKTSIYSQAPLEVHFGLGDAGSVKITIEWPGRPGETDVRYLRANRYVIIE